MRIPARPVLTGALCLAFTCAGAEVALAQSDTVPSTSTPAPTARTAQQPRIKVSHKRLALKAGRHAVVRGRLAPRVPGIRVALQVFDGRRWVTLDRDRTGGAGRYVLRDRVRSTLSRPVRVKNAAGPGILRGTRRLGRLNVFRVAYASWYGPGLYGNRLGCGGTLYAGRLGVAHKSLPCGAMVTLKRGRRSVRVPVIDRGPYVGGREFDLTAATAARLGFHGHGVILTTR